jgi:hypothetical protein
MGEMAVMGKKGDTKTIWNPRDPDEVSAARKVFDDLKAKGFAAFHATGDEGKKGEKMRSFDVTAGKVILVPPMGGGC